MNFHKTIGFLATLLLTLGLGVPDSFAQTVSLEFNPSSMNEGGGLAVGKLVVSATLDADAAAATTVTVTLEAADAGNTINLATTGDGVGLALSLTAVEVVIAKDQRSKTEEISFTYDPPQDDDADDETYVVFGSHTGTVTQTGNNASPKATFKVIDDEVGVESIALEFDPPSMNEADGVTVGKLVVTATLEADATAATTVTVDLDAATSGNTINLVAGTGVSDALDLADAVVVIAKGQSSNKVERTFSYDPQEDDTNTTPPEVVAEDETYVVFGSHIGTPVQTGPAADRSPSATFKVIDDEVGVESIALMFDPSSMDESGGLAVGKLVVTATLEADAIVATTVNVTLAAADAGNTIDLTITTGLGEGVSDALSLTAVDVVIAKGDRSDKVEIPFSYDPQPDDNADDETYVVFGSHTGTVTQTGNNASPKATFKVIDDEVGVESIALEFDPSSMDESGGLAVGKLVVTATLEADAAAATTVTVDLDAATGANVNTIDLATAGDGVGLALALADVEVVIAKGDRSDKVEIPFSYDPQEDTDDPIADETYVVFGSHTGTPVQTGPAADRSPSATFTVIDDEKPVPGAVTGIAFSPEMLSLTEEMAFTQTVTVTVSAAAGTAQTVDVVLSVAGVVTDPSALGITATTVSVPIERATKATSGTATITVTYEPPDGDYTADDGITITGTGGGQSGTLKLNIADNDVGALTGVSFDPAMIDFVEGTEKTAAVAVTVEAMAGAAQTVSVELSSDISLPLGTINSPIAVPIAADATSGAVTVSLTYMPPPDEDSDDVTVTITGTANADMTDEQSGTLTLNVADDEMGAVTGVTFVPDMIDFVEGTEKTATVTVTVSLAAGAPNALDVVLDPTGATLAELNITSPVSIPVPRGATSVTAPVTITYMPSPDDDLDDETVTITGTVGGRSGTLTLNVDDNTQSKGTITVSTSMESIRENSRTRNVVVTATLDDAPATGTTVVVEVEVTGGTERKTVQIPIVGPATSGEATVAITPVNDEVFTTKSFTVTGRVAGYESGMATIDIVDDDGAIGELTITAAEPPSITAGDAIDVTLTVKGLIFDKEVDSGTVTATMTTNVGMFPNGTKSDELTINMADHVDLVPDEDSPDGTAKIVLSISADEATAGTMITVTATADMYEDGSRVIPVRDRDAADVQGYRLVVVKPAAAGGWAIDANDAVIVDVMRVGSVAYPWSDFDNIRVSVRDTAHDNTDPAHQIDWVMASNFNLEDNGAVTFDETHTGNSRGDVIWKGNDTIRFEIQIHHCQNEGSNTNKEVNAREAGKCGANEPSSNGQYLGAYVVADFTVGTTTTPLSNMDSDKPVYPSNPTLIDEANRYIGDGKLFKVDNLDPSNAAIAAVRVTSGSGDDQEVGGNIIATSGDEIRVAVKVSGDVLFRESGLRFQLQTQDGKGEYRGITYPAADVAPVTVTINCWRCSGYCR